MSFIFSSSNKPENVSFEDQASWLSKTFLLYLNPLFALGSSATADKQIELVDLGPTSTQDRALVLYTEFMKQWQHERRLKPEQRSLWYVLWRTVGYNKLIYAIGLYLLYSASSFGPVLILNALVKHFQGTSELSTSTLWILVSLMFVIPMIGSVFAAHSNVELAHCGVQFRNAMVTAIYRKSLRLSPGSKQQSSTGQIVNMFSNDTAQLQRFLFFLNNMIVAIPMIVVCLFLIYLQVGVSTFVGLGLIIITIPLNAVVFGWLGEIRKRKVLVTDKRVKLMNEVLNGIRIIKFYAWEVAFSQRIESVRLAELKLIRKIAYIIAIAFSLVLMAVPTFLPVLIFYTYVRLGNQLDAAKAFTAISLFNLLQFPFLFLPLGLTQYSQSRVSTQRMLQFLELEELAPYVDKTEGVGGVVVEMAGVCMGWMEESNTSSTGGSSSSTVPVGETDGKTGYSKVGMKEEDEGPVRDKSEASQAVKEVELTNPTTTTTTAAAAGTTTGTTTIDNTSVNNSIKGNNDSEQNRSIYTLTDLNFHIKKGELVAVVGTVGSGKSSLLNGLLGEMILQKGSVRVCGSIAYCDQRPWILNDTVQGNVLFGLPYDEERFDSALYAANMEDDVTVLPGGINTQIGERGINLSGGQKARVAFARAIYSNADVYLLDDPLSAVDAHVGQFLFHEGIRTHLSGKTRVLVTHQVHLLPFFDKIIVMDNGQIKAFGDYETLQRSGIDLEAFVPAAAAVESSAAEEVSRRGSESSTSTTHHQPQHQSMGVPGAPSGSPRTTPGGSQLQTQRKRLGSADSHSSSRSMSSSHHTTATTTAAVLASATTVAAAESAAIETHSVDVEVSKSPPLSPNGNFQENKDKAAQQALLRRQDTRATTLNSSEERQVGDVTSDIYLYYIKAGGAGMFALMCCLIVCAQACQILSSFWLSYWGEVSVNREEDGDQLSTSRNIFFLNVFAALSSLNLLFYMARSIALADHRLGASVDLHRGILKATLFAPIAFFDVTPIGRILNRFSSDLLTVDEEISQSVSQGLNSIANVASAIGAIAGATKGTFLVLLLPIALFYHLIQKFFKATNTAVARIESISRSPIYADFSQALNGMTTIRAYDDVPRFVTGLEKCVDANSVANVTQQIAAQWLAIRLDMIGALISFFMAVLAASAPGFIPPGFLALGLTYSFQLTTYLKFLVRMMAQLEAQLNSVERVKYYMDNIEQEGALLKEHELPLEKIPEEWPARGVIEATDLQLRYRDGPLVLKGLSFHVQGAEKVGVAGRTGSGKSSLMIGLFRIQELAAGCIKIDDIDISQVPLSLLRSKLGIIPQDPVMFSASVRFNLDPFDAHSDSEIWQVLEAIAMKEHVLSLPNKLAEEVAEGGDNFSAGQRQLICIARAILRKPKILVLDEATASIDNETDALVQRMVREQFQQCTVLTIAHRLNTIIDSDKVMVMDDGKLAEFDSPERLLAVPDGLFRALWDKHVQSHTQQQQ